jgi:hypothetical protein
MLFCCARKDDVAAFYLDQQLLKGNTMSGPRKTAIVVYLLEVA